MINSKRTKARLLRLYQVLIILNFSHMYLLLQLLLQGFRRCLHLCFRLPRYLQQLSEDGDAPKIFSKQTKKKFKMPLPAIALTSTGLILSIVTSLLLPDKVYEYITTAAALMLLYNWFFILTMYHRLIEPTTGDKVKRVIGMIFVASAVSGSLFHKTSRPGFFISLAFVTIIAIVVLLLRKRWKKEEAQNSA